MPTLQQLNVDLDDKDRAILAERQIAFDLREGARVGDFVRMKDGTLRRFTHAYEHGLQTTVGPQHPNDGDARFYLSAGGYLEFSGSLDPIVPRDKLKLTGQTLPGPCWFFHHDYVTAHNGVPAHVMCRVYEVQE